MKNIEVSIIQDEEIILVDKRVKSRRNRTTRFHRTVLRLSYIDDDGNFYTISIGSAESGCYKMIPMKQYEFDKLKDFISKFPKITNDYIETKNLVFRISYPNTVDEFVVRSRFVMILSFIKKYLVIN